MRRECVYTRYPYSDPRKSHRKWLPALTAERQAARFSEGSRRLSLAWIAGPWMPPTILKSDEAATTVTPFQAKAYRTRVAAASSLAHPALLSLGTRQE